MPLLTTMGGGSVRSLGRAFRINFVSAAFIAAQGTALNNKTIELYVSGNKIATFKNNTSTSGTGTSRTNLITWHDSATQSYFNTVRDFAPCSPGFSVGVTGGSCNVINHCYDQGFYLNASGANYCTTDGRNWDPIRRLSFRGGNFVFESIKCGNCWNGSTNAPLASDVSTTTLISGGTANQQFIILD